MNTDFKISALRCSNFKTGYGWRYD